MHIQPVTHFFGTPRRVQRIAVASVIAAAAFALVYISALRGSVRTDFSLIWFGANALLHGANPYALVGPGMVFDSQWPALYPATAYLLGIPFALLPESLASAAFVGLSAFLLAYGATGDSWHRLPMFASVAFLSAAHVGQWSIIFTAALFIPWLGIVFPAKPQLAITMLAANGPVRKNFVIAACSALALLAASVVLLPTWPSDWLRLIQEAEQMVPPLLSPGGFIVLFAVLLRWRRPEAWLVAFMVAMPQTWYPYNLLPLLAIAGNYREACILSLTSSVGCLAAVYLADAVGSPSAIYAAHAFIIAFAFIPAAFIVLMRRNSPAQPAFVLHPAPSP